MPQLITSSARRQTPGGVPYTLVQGFPKVTINANSAATAVEEYLIDPANFDALIADLMPTPVKAGNEIVLLPRYFMPGTNFLAMESLTCEPHNGSLPGDPFQYDTGAPSGTYDQILKVTINYKTSEHKEDQEQNKPETFLERSMSATSEMLIIQNSPTLKIIDEVDGAEITIKNPNSNPTIKLVPLIEHTMSWKRAISPNFSNMFSVLGTTNEEEYAFLYDLPATSTLFLGWTAKQEFQYAGNQVIISPWNIDLKFATKYVQDTDLNRVYHWNHVYNPDTQRWQLLKRRVKVAGGGFEDRLLYPSGNFNDIFDPVTIE